MNVEIGAETALFPEKESYVEFSLQCIGIYVLCGRGQLLRKLPKLSEWGCAVSNKLTDGGRRGECVGGDSNLLM